MDENISSKIEAFIRDLYAEVEEELKNLVPSHYDVTTDEGKKLIKSWIIEHEVYVQYVPIIDDRGIEITITIHTPEYMGENKVIKREVRFYYEYDPTYILHRYRNEFIKYV